MTEPLLLIAENATKSLVSPLEDNIALNKPAQQSSTSRWSKPNDAQGAVNGIKTGRFGFHTDKESNPWWQVDLETLYVLSEVRVYNRIDTDRERANTLLISVSPDNYNWQQIYLNQPNNIFGGIDGKPLIVPINSTITRFLRVELNQENYLHLDQVEIFGSPFAPKFDRILDSTAQPNNLDKDGNNSTSQRNVNSRHIIYHAQKVGLCNRLMTLSSCLSLSDLWNIPLTVCWQPSPACNCYFQDLFDPIFRDVNIEEMTQMLNDRNCQTLYINVASLSSHFSSKQYFDRQDKSYQDFQAKYRQFAQQILIKPSIKSPLGKFISKHWTDDIVGVHIRRTDHVKHLSKKPDGTSLISTNDKFFKKINLEISKGVSKFFLATDDVETKTIFETKYPGMFISYCQEFDKSKLRQTTVQDALSDLYLLSQTNKIIGSKCSSFSKYASEMGNIPLVWA
jgi:hypothetical protein